MIPINIYFTIILIISGSITTIISLYSWRRRSTINTLSFSLFMFALSIYSIAYGMELTNSTLEGMLFWIKIEYIGISPIPALFIITAIQFVGKTKWLKPAVILALLVIPAGTLIINLTNEYHHLFYSQVSVNSGGLFPVLAITKGPWYYVHIAYTNSALLFGNILFTRMFFRTKNLFRRQALIMLIGSLVPWATLIIYLSGNNPLGLDINPFMFSVSGIILTLGIFRYRLINILPIARDTVFDNIQDGIIVLDSKNSIVDINPAAQKFTGGSPEHIGTHIETLVTNWEDLFKGENNSNDLVIEFTVTGECETSFTFRDYPIMSRYGKPAGRILSIRDITEEKRLELIIKKNEKKLRDDIARVRKIQAHLMPKFNVIDGYDIGDIFIPADELSGDFIDCYHISDDIFQVVICDVMDHGTASSYIGMQIRTMLKAISEAGLKPSEIIQNANLKLHDDFKAIYYFASLVLCHLNTKTGTLLYSSGGHPPSLIYNSTNNAINETEFTGPLLGMFSDAKYTDIPLKLGKDDCLLLYTDGTYEAMKEDTKEIYGMDRLVNDLKYNIRNSSRDIIQTITANIFEFIEYNSLDDDISMICIKKE